MSSYIDKRNTPPKEPASRNENTRPKIIRFISVILVFVMVGGYLGWKLSELQIKQVDMWRTEASKQHLKSTPIAPMRGTIYDSNMKQLARSAPAWTVVAAPDVLNKGKLDPEATSETDAARLAAAQLAEILGVDEAELYEKLADKDSKWAKVKEKIDKPTADLVREMVKTYNVKGIYLQEDTKRYYPYDDLASTVLGFVNTDGDGIEGLEKQYNEVLAGTPGRTVTVLDSWGTKIPTEEAEIHPAEDGNSLVLTINSDIQMVLDRYLSQAVTMHQAKQRGMGIVMDVNTGAILAMSTSPSYDPNQPYFILNDATRETIDAMEDQDAKSQAQLDARMLQWRNKAVADAYEPGSVLKVVTAAAAIDSGRYNMNSTFTCTSSIEIADRTFGCALGKAHGTITLGEALIESCNVSFVKMGEGMGASTWYDYVKAFGLTEPTGIDLPGEPGLNAIKNLVYSENQLGPVQLASCSFGQSNKYTALQMITAVSAAVNGGNLMQPHLVHQIIDSQGNVVKTFDPVVKRQVISSETSAQLAQVMEEMVSTTQYGRNAFVAGYHVGGKSGTSQKLDLLAQGAEKQEYISSFVGFAPANDPQIAVLIVLDEPEDPKVGTYFGGRLAGPTVGNVINESLQILGVEPDFSGEGDQNRNTVSAPTLVGNDIASAQVTLNQKGLRYITIGDGPNVTGQFPQGYTQIPANGQIVLYTDPSIPQEMVRIPDLSEKSASSAIDTLNNLGMNVLTSGAPDGASGVVVVSQDIAPDTEVPKGTIITLVMEDRTAVADVG